MEAVIHPGKGDMCYREMLAQFGVNGVQVFQRSLAFSVAWLVRDQKQQPAFLLQRSEHVERARNDLEILRATRRFPFGSIGIVDQRVENAVTVKEDAALTIRCHASAFTMRCHTTACQPSACGVIRSCETTGTRIVTLESCFARPPSRLTIDTIGQPISLAYSIAHTRFFDVVAEPPPTE